ncbi:5-dehydro-4-deoxyglucarate dehydratase [Saccharopolyspora aridisoli]|uniref:Probable 5-dehydro-4-deoxyglucarate dehydratase n=1 Tax=Saccharopolyspora aridisoli TaxID=2530385 RepID=A0A4R4UN08_9PSEU|nr:5-dehydro-4-deoxyglucarate dehydratase [Saccharopolyspora aridisoli]TDC93488.1 5-dehydro-4-deoxyglucarate dehydratase [Saccharopolyspora aridisoli]
MSQFTPHETAKRLSNSLLSFPVTHFRDDLSFDEPAYRENIAWLSEFGAAGLFAAGGTGEFFSLTPDEVSAVVRAAVGETPDDVPVIAPAGYGTATAIELARTAERAGADGLLLLPPYLTEASQDGLIEHVKAVCAATSLGVIIYNRANAVYTDETVARLADACANLVGFKDGVGDIERMTRIHTRLGDRLTYVGGLPTAEAFALPYLEMGVTTYSSAMYNFVPEFAQRFYTAVRAHDRAAVDRYLAEFVLPYCDIRNRKAGYAVSIVKAGMRAIGRPAGPVRAPLTDLDDDELQQLSELISRIPEENA